jgi:energy-coupling factor transporter transmembrane protein EcfT
MFFSFNFVFVLLLLLLLIKLSFILISIYLCFFFSYFKFVLIGLHFGVIPSSKIDGCLEDAIGLSGGADFSFGDNHSSFMCNRKYTGSFLKGLELNVSLR